MAEGAGLERGEQTGGPSQCSPTGCSQSRPYSEWIVCLGLQAFLTHLMKGFKGTHSLVCALYSRGQRTELKSELTSCCFFVHAELRETASLHVGAPPFCL